VPKETQKEDFKNLKEESWNCFSLSWNGTRYGFWEYTNYCRRKAYWILISNNFVFLWKCCQLFLCTKLLLTTPIFVGTDLW